MTDATNHFAGKKMFIKLDCSQVYNSVQRSDGLSVHFLAFKFASRIFAFIRYREALINPPPASVHL